MELERPHIEKPEGDVPFDLGIDDLVVGEGDEATKGSKVEVHYVGVAFSTGEEFDASWNRGQPFRFTLGKGQVIPGWDQGVAGMRVGGRRKLTIPSAMAYGARGAGGVIKPNEPLVFVVDLLVGRLACGREDPGGRGAVRLRAPVADCHVLARLERRGGRPEDRPLLRGASAALDQLVPVDPERRLHERRLRLQRDRDLRRVARRRARLRADHGQVDASRSGPGTHAPFTRWNATADALPFPFDSTTAQVGPAKSSSTFPASGDPSRSDRASRPSDRARSSSSLLLRAAAAAGEQRDGDAEAAKPPHGGYFSCA